MDLSRDETDVGCQELDIDRAEFSTLAAAAQRGLAAEFLKLFLRSARRKPEAVSRSVRARPRRLANSLGSLLFVAWEHADWSPTGPTPRAQPTAAP